MSFSKAKIQRFNELSSEAPPPGSYDPKVNSKGKEFAIEKSRRFNDNRSVTSNGSECSKSVSIKSKVPLISPKFRTPQLLKKRLIKVLSTSCPKAKTKLNLDSKESSYDRRDELADLKVECTNKDKTIQDQEKCMDEMNNEVERLKKLLIDGQQKMRDVEEQHKRDLESMTNLQQDILNSHDEQHQAELNFLRAQLLEALESKEKDYSAHQSIVEDLKSRITELSMRSALLETELNNEKKKSKEYDRLYGEFQSLERLMEARGSGYIEQPNEINHEIIGAGLAEIMVEDERKFIEAGEETDEQMKLTVDGSTRHLQSSESSNGFLQLEFQRIQGETELSTNVPKNLQQLLETRQQVILNLQEQLSSLQCDMDEVKAENERIMSECQSKISELIATHAAEINEITADFITEQHLFEDEREVNNSKCLEIERKNNELLSENIALINEIRDIKKKYDDLKLSYRQVENELANEREFSDILEDNHREEIQQLKEQIECKKKMKNSEKKTLKNSNKLETSSTISEANSLEEQLIERDNQILELTSSLEELKITSATQESFSQSLQEELDRAEAELVNKKKELKDLKEQIREETAEMVTRRRRFDVVMAENQATVAALSARLAESNEEVERLQNELKSSEELIIEQRKLLSAMRDSSKLVNEQMLSLVERIDTTQLLDDLEKANLSDIENVKVLFQNKIDELEDMSQKAINDLQTRCAMEENDKIKLQGELREMSKKFHDIQGILLALEEQNDAYCIEISKLQLSKAKVEQKLEDHISESEEMKKSLESEVERYKNISEDLESRANKLLKMTEVLKKDQLKYEKLNKAFEDQALLLKAQTELRKSAEAEKQRLAESCKNLEESYHELTEKYEKLIGNENYKQRLKDLTQLKEKIVDLEKDLGKKCYIIEQQNKTIERLHAEERRRTFTKGKENLGTISKSPFNTPTSSPHKPLTPLRDRND